MRSIKQIHTFRGNLTGPNLIQIRPKATLGALARRLGPCTMTHALTVFVNGIPKVFCCAAIMAWLGCRWNKEELSSSERTDSLRQ